MHFEKKFYFYNFKRCSLIKRRFDETKALLFLFSSFCLSKEAMLNKAHLNIKMWVKGPRTLQYLKNHVNSTYRFLSNFGYSQEVI